MKRIVYVLIGMSLCLSSCMYAIRYDGTYKGKIVDSSTGEPVEGVVVLGTWYTVMHTAAGGMYHYYDAKETVTDENGDFAVSGQGLRVLSNLKPMRVLIFKAGYEYMDYSWETLKGDETLIDKAKWEGDKAIISLKKLTMEEVRDGLPSRPNIPMEKMSLLTKEINKARIKTGLTPFKIEGN